MDVFLGRFQGNIIMAYVTDHRFVLHIQKNLQGNE